MTSILDELKAKANGAADGANNIQEAVSMMEFGGGASLPVIVFRNDQTVPAGKMQWTCDSTFDDITTRAQSCSVIFALILKKNSGATDFVTKSVALYIGTKDGGTTHVFKTFSMDTKGASDRLTITKNNFVTYEEDR